MRPVELAECLAYLRRMWPNFRAPERFAEVWAELLLDLDAPALRAAIDDLATEGREFAPPPGVLRRRACELVAEASGETLTDPEAALREVYATIARVGTYRAPSWSSPAIANVIDALGGWEAVCASENPEALRAHFLRLYGVCAERKRRELSMPPSVLALASGLASKLALTSGDDR